MLALLLSPTGLAILDVPDDYQEVRVAAPGVTVFNPVLDPRTPAHHERIFRRIGRSHSYEEYVVATP